MHTLPSDVVTPPENVAQTTASQPPLSPSKTIIIGLSGPSSSGKTTLGRLLRSIFNVVVVRPEGAGTGRRQSEDEQNKREYRLSLFILHQDDFYKTDKDVPWVTISSTKYGVRKDQDWDCVGSLDLPLFRRTLTHVRDFGTLPPDNVSMEDQNSVGDVHVTTDQVEGLRKRVKSWFERLIRESRTTGGGGTTTTTTTTTKEFPREIRICLLEGFLLFPPSPTATPAKDFATSATSGLAGDETVDLARLSDLMSGILNSKLFLPCTKKQMMERRERRTGYVTLEGFWKDPPGYVEDLVWVNYKRYHGWMYRDHDTEKDQEQEKEDEEFDEEKCRRQGVELFLQQDGQKVGQGTMKECLEWGVERVEEAVMKLI